MQVKIFSFMAAINGGDPIWIGEVEDRLLQGEHQLKTPAQVLETIFRLFARVTDDDCHRLEEWGYRLPSLSVGDYVVIEEDGDIVTYRCSSIGFVQITGSVDAAMEAFR